MCTAHRPLWTRWQRLYRGWRAYESPDPAHEPHSAQDDEVEGEEEADEDAEQAAAALLTVGEELWVRPRRFLSRRQAIDWDHERAHGSFRLILLSRLDWLQVWWIVVSQLFGLVFIGLVHDASPGWWLPFSFYCECFFAGSFLFYWCFRHFMIRRLPFFYTVCGSLGLAVLLTHLPFFVLWLWNRSVWFALGTLLSSFLLLLFSLVSSALIIGVPVLYEL
jgi:hypothetical protein